LPQPRHLNQANRSTNASPNQSNPFSMHQIPTAAVVGSQPRGGVLVARFPRIARRLARKVVFHFTRGIAKKLRSYAMKSMI